MKFRSFIKKYSCFNKLFYQNHTMDNTEKDIINGIKQGDEQAFRYLFDHHYALLCQISASFLKDDFLAETIVGDVIFHLWEKRETLDIQISLRAYLVRAVRNRCINYLNQRYVQSETRITPTEEALINTSTNQNDHYPMAALLEKELEQEIEKSIQNLPKECRTVFQMSRFEDMKYQEIADKLNISVNTVKYHIKNALAILNKDLSRYLTTILVCWVYFFK